MSNDIDEIVNDDKELSFTKSNRNSQLHLNKLDDFRKTIKETNEKDIITDGSTLITLPDLNFSIQVKKMYGPFQDTSRRFTPFAHAIPDNDENNISDLYISHFIFTGNWTRLKTPIKLIFESDNESNIEFVDHSDKSVKIIYDTPYTYSIIENGKVSWIIILAIAIACVIAIAILIGSFIYFVVIRKRPVENYIYN